MTAAWVSAAIAFVVLLITLVVGYGNLRALLSEMHTLLKCVVPDVKELRDGMASLEHRVTVVEARPSGARAKVSGP